MNSVYHTSWIIPHRIQRLPPPCNRQGGAIPSSQNPIPNIDTNAISIYKDIKNINTVTMKTGDKMALEMLNASVVVLIRRE